MNAEVFHAVVWAIIVTIHIPVFTWVMLDLAVEMIKFRRALKKHKMTLREFISGYLAHSRQS